MPTAEQMARDPYWAEERKAQGELLRSLFNQPLQEEAVSEDEVEVRSQLPMILKLIEEHDTDYQERYPLVLWALSAAADEGYQAGIRLDPEQPEWPVVYIELPTGQVSWHMPQHPVEWDGHSPEQKYERCRAFTAQMEV